MSMTQEEPTLHELVSRVAALEQANARLHDELTSLRAERATAEEHSGRQVLPRRRKSSRRQVLTTSLGMAVASVGAGAMLEMSGGTAFAKPKPGPGVFASNMAGTPAVSATGTNGADGVDASSDSGIGVLATSTSGPGLLAKSSSGLAGHFVGNVSMDNNLNVTGFLSSGPVVGNSTSLKGTGVMGTASGALGIGVFGSSSGLDGVLGVSSSGTGVAGRSHTGAGVAGGSESIGVVGGSSSVSGIGVLAINVSKLGVEGTALQVQGHIQVQGEAVGQATLLKGQTSVTVSTPAATTASNILLTPLDHLTGTLWVTRAVGSFTINDQHPESSDIRIAFLVIN